MADFFALLQGVNLGFLWLLAGLALAYCLVLWRLGMFTPPALKATRQFARDREIGDFRPIQDKLAERSSLLRRLYNSVNIRVLLAVAGLKHDPAAWSFRTIALAVAASAFFFFLDGLAYVTGTQTYAWWLSLIPGVVVAALFYMRLRTSALKRRESIEAGLGDSFIILAILAYHQRMVLTELLPLLARCQKDQQLWSLLKDENWKPLTDEYRTKMRMPEGNVGFAVQYELIGAAYEIPTFETLGRVLRRILERGQSPTEVLTQEASRQADEKLADAKINIQKSKTNVFIPIALMLIPLFIMIGAPIGYDLYTIFVH